MTMLRPLVSTGAIFDPSHRYRYVLWRNFVLDPTNVCLWIMLNPSKAAVCDDDPTVRRCQSFSSTWGHDAVRVVNIFALRATDPTVLTRVNDPIGMDNDEHIAREISGARRIVCAWGNPGILRGRGAAVRAMLESQRTSSWCFKQNQNGTPVHPLYIPLQQPLVKFT